MYIAIIRERKSPPDARVALTPDICQKIDNDYNYVRLEVEPSAGRCFSDEEYKVAGIELNKAVREADVLLGVKEVPIEHLIPQKTYFFFSHTIKKQAYNRELLRSLVKKQIKMVDYEALTDKNGQRVIAFGRFAGMVGAHNALYTWFQRHQLPGLPRMKDFKEYAEAQEHYNGLQFPELRIVLTGGGRVANGAAEVLDDMGYEKLSPTDYRLYDKKAKVYTQLNCEDYARRKIDGGFVKAEFFSQPHLYESSIHPFLKKTDIFINGIFWDNRAPAFFTLEDMRSDEFDIQVIADITCDIAPLSSIPSTIRPSTIEDPVYGFDPILNKETKPYIKSGVDMMAIDNLPNELPRNASRSFANQFYEHVMPELDDMGNSTMIANATVTENGDLGMNFEYLRDFLEGKE